MGDAGFAGTSHDIGTVGVELLGIDVCVGVDEYGSDGALHQRGKVGAQFGLRLVGNGDVVQMKVCLAIEIVLTFPTDGRKPQKGIEASDGGNLRLGEEWVGIVC